MSFIIASPRLKRIFIGSGNILATACIENEETTTGIFDWEDLIEENIVAGKDGEDEGAGSKEDGPKPKSVDEIVILCLAHSNGPRNMLAVGTNQKLIHVLELSNDGTSATHLLSSAVPKAPTVCTFDRDDSHVIVGDRSGDVHRFAIADGQLVELAGAISMVLDAEMSVDGKRIMITDRDEKLRVIRYPQTCVIESFGLGHVEYVKSVSNGKGDTAWTGSGDGSVKCWDVSNGKCLRTVDIKESKEPVRKVLFLGDRVAVLLEKCPKIHFVDAITEERISLSSRLSCELLDMAICGDKLVVLSRTEILVLHIGPCTLSKTITPDDLLAKSLETTNDAVDNLFKNVTHNNQEEYQKRKQERIVRVGLRRAPKRKATMKN